MLRILVLGRQRWQNPWSLLLKLAESADSRPVRETLFQRRKRKFFFIVANENRLPLCRDQYPHPFQDRLLLTLSLETWRKSKVHLRTHSRSLGTSLRNQWVFWFLILLLPFLNRKLYAHL